LEDEGFSAVCVEGDDGAGLGTHGGGLFDSAEAELGVTDEGAGGVLGGLSGGGGALGFAVGGVGVAASHGGELAGAHGAAEGRGVEVVGLVVFDFDVADGVGVVGEFVEEA